jgi:NAD(P)-dependent dehydrogenase (short-subunit alcohol dehydrogenase family)
MTTTKKVIAVTGASRGIGAAIALELAHRGYTVACLTRKGVGPQTQAAKPYAQRFLDVACDVTDEVSLKAAFAEVAQKAGALHGLVNNAGIHLDGASHELPTATYEKVMATNATAVFAACREAYPHLVKGGGTIVNIGSFFDKLGVKRNVAYCASKAAVGAITRCLAVEWANRGIRVLDVAPGYIVTDLNREAMTRGALADYLKKRIPSGVSGTTGDVAKLVAAIFSEDIPFLSGETIYIDGAQGIAH